jgi:phage terminase small subunit
MKRLTAKDRLFCYEYIADEKLNPESAALKVGYAASVAKSKAYQWVSNSKENPKPQIKAFVDNLLKQKEQSMEYSSARIDQELCKIGFSNIADILEKMGGHINIKLLKELSDAQKCAISEIYETESDGMITRKIKLHNKIDALKTLLKRLGKDEDNLNLTVNIIKDSKIIATKTINDKTSRV